MKLHEAKRTLQIHIEFLRDAWKPHPDYKVLEALAIGIEAIEKAEQSQTHNGGKHMGQRTYKAEEYKANKKGYSSDYTWIIVDGENVIGCARGNHYAGCSCRNNDRALSCTEECAARCVKDVIECLSDKDRQEIGNVKFKERTPEEIERRLSKRDQQRALSLKRTIEAACMCHGLDLTLYGGGIGVVDPISRKIIMVWKPLFKLEDNNGEN